MTIANVSCPAAGDAQVAAVAIAVAASDERSIASAAIAGVLTAGVDITSTFQQTALLAVPQRRRVPNSGANSAVTANPLRLPYCQGLPSITALAYPIPSQLAG